MLSRRRTHSPGCIGCMEGHPQTTALSSEVIDIIKNHWTSLTIIEYPWYLSDSVGMNAKGGESEKAQTRLVLVTKQCKGSHWSRCEILSDLALISHFQMVFRFCGLYNDYKWLINGYCSHLLAFSAFVSSSQFILWTSLGLVAGSTASESEEVEEVSATPLSDLCETNVAICDPSTPEWKTKQKDTKGVYGIVYCGTWDLIDLVGFGKQL